VPVVQTLHNYRLLCPGATFYRDGAVCEDCTRHLTPWPSVIHRCYHGSAAHTGAVALMVTLHRVLGTWQKAVSLFITSSQFEKRKFVEHGFPESKILVKPNSVANPGAPTSGGQHFVFVGRLSVEKGVLTLLNAMDYVSPATRLTIAGDGPLEPLVRIAVSQDNRIQYLGRISQREVLELLATARCLILPSEWYETFGRVAAEAFSRGTPVIASNIGAVAEVVENGRTGFHFRCGDARNLAETMERAAANPEMLARMRLEARREYEQKFTPERNFDLLMHAYHNAIGDYGRGTRASTRGLLSSS
jgi:glycosyltransferase involved in cell wall biosynthesis